MILSKCYLHIRSKYQEYASHVNTNKRNTIYTKIQSQRFKVREVSASEVPKVTKEKFKIKKRNLLDESSKDMLLSKANNNDI